MKYIITQYVTYSGEVEADNEEQAHEKWQEMLDSDTDIIYPVSVDYVVEEQ